MPVIAALLLCAFCWLADYSLDKHQEASYSKQQVAMLNALATKDEPRPIAIKHGVHYYTDRDAAILTARIWNIEVRP